MTKQLLLQIAFIMFSANFIFAQTKITGTITDANSQPISGANIVLKGKITGTITDDGGNFELITSVSLPFILVASSVGFQRQEIIVDQATTPVSIILTESIDMMDEVVFSASRVDQRILESPVSVEKMTLGDIANTPSISFYDGLENINDSKW